MDTDRGSWWVIVHGVTKESDTTKVTEHAGKVSVVLLGVQYSPSAPLE